MRRRAVTVLIGTGILVLTLFVWSLLCSVASRVEKTAIYEPLNQDPSYDQYVWQDRKNLLSLRYNARNQGGINHLDALTGLETRQGNLPHLGDTSPPLIAPSPDGKRVLIKSASSLLLVSLDSTAGEKTETYPLGQAQRFAWIDANRWAVPQENAGRVALSVYDARTPNAPPVLWNHPALQEKPFILGFNQQGEAIAIDRVALKQQAKAVEPKAANLFCSFPLAGPTIRFLRFNPTSTTPETINTILLPPDAMFVRLALSPDGTKIAWAVRGYMTPDLNYQLRYLLPNLLMPTRTLPPNAQDALWVSDADGRNFRRLTQKALNTIGFPYLLMPFWTPDSQSIGYWREGQLYRVSVG